MLNTFRTLWGSIVEIFDTEGIMGTPITPKIIVLQSHIILLIRVLQRAHSAPDW